MATIDHLLLNNLHPEQAEFSSVQFIYFTNSKIYNVIYNQNILRSVENMTHTQKSTNKNYISTKQYMNLHFECK